MNKLQKIIGLYIFSVCLISCASSKNSISYIDQEDEYIISTDENIENKLSEETLDTSKFTEDFLGNFNPVLLKSILCLFNKGKEMKPKELTKTYLVPSNNTVEIYFRDGMNQIAIILNQKEREKIINSANIFLEEYESKTLNRDKTTIKNSYHQSKTGLYFGLASYGNGTDYCEYYTNSEIINKHAYFLLKFNPTRTDNNYDFTPSCALYFSPSQLKDFIEIISQEYLESQVKDLQLRAYTY